MNFDIDAIEQSADATFDLIIGHNEDKTPAGFTVVGTASDQYAAVTRQIELLNVKEAAARDKADEGKASELDMTTDEGAAQVVDSGDVRRMMVVKACVVGWFGMRKGSKPAEFTTDALVRLLELRPLWVRKIVAAIEDDGNFMKG